MNTQTSVENTLSHSKTNIIARNPDFGEFKDLNIYWSVGNPKTSFAQSFFSMVIPEGEKFFIRSVLAMKDQIDNPKLLEDIKLFSQQEAIHTKKHIEFNEALRAQGYDVDAVTERARKFFAFIEKYVPKKIALSITVFAEHMTALGGELEMRFPEMTEGTHPQAAAFWRWHAAEELEHKSVAFDVLRAVGGTYFHRMAAIVVLFSIEPFFMWPVIRRQLALYRKMETTEKPLTFKEIGDKNPDLFRRVGAFAKSYFFSYFKPSFHPWQVDGREYLQKWRENNPSISLS